VNGHAAVPPRPAAVAGAGQRRGRNEDGDRSVLPAAVADPSARPALQGRRRDGARRGLFLRSSFAGLAFTAWRRRRSAAEACRWAGWRAVCGGAWLLVLTFVVQLLFALGGLLTLGPLHLSSRGLAIAGYLSLRLIVLVVASLLLTLTTPPIALTDALAWLGRPLRRLHVPTRSWRSW